MKPIELTAQILSLFAMAMNILSYQNRNKKAVIAFQLVGSVLFSVSFFLLGSMTGGILNLIGTVRGFVFVNKEKLRADRPVWLVGFTLSYIASYILSFTLFGKEPTLFYLIVELLPVIGMTVTTVSFQKKDAKAVRLLGLINSPLWLTYNVIAGSLGGVCSEIIGLLSIIIGILRFDRKKERDDARLHDR